MRVRPICLPAGLNLTVIKFANDYERLSESLVLAKREIELGADLFARRSSLANCLAGLSRSTDCGELASARG